MITEEELKEKQKKALEKPKYKRSSIKVDEIQSNDLTPLFEMAFTGLKRTAPATKYTDDKKGLELFKKLSMEYLEELQKANETASENNNMRLVPDIESWGLYLGISRITINNYEKNYNDDWKAFIGRFKNGITAFKKSLAFNSKIPPVLAIFDLANNSDYYNSSEFTIKTENNSNNAVYYLPSERMEKLRLDRPTEQDLIENPDLKIEKDLDLTELPKFN
jgi:hypothetical protein